MILSLLKIGLLSVAFAFPFSKVATSSNQDHVATIEEKASIKRLNYNNTDDSITIQQNDFNLGFLNNFDISSFVESNQNDSISIYYFTDDLKHSTSSNFKIQDSVCYFTIALNKFVCIDFNTKTLYTASSRNGVIEKGLDIQYLTMVDSNSTYYGDFFGGLKSYINDNTLITFSASDMNTYSYRLFALYVIQNISLFDNISQVSYQGVNGIVNSTENSVKFEIGDDNIYIYTESENHPNYIFYSNDLNDYPFGYWEYPLNLYVNDFDLYNNVIGLVQNRQLIADSSTVESFTFSYSFNYNAPYNLTRDELFVLDSYFDSSNPSDIKYIKYDLPYFYSNGELFNAMWVEYDNGYGMRYSKNNGQDFVSGSSGTAYFKHLWYVNNDSGLRRTVYFRGSAQYTDNSNNIQTYLVSGGTWINNDYRYLSFLNALSSTERNNIAQFNNGGQFTGINGGNVDLNSVFSLFSSTLMSFTTFFSIVILPGITIGTLLLIPFAITLLLIVIKLFRGH